MQKISSFFVLCFFCHLLFASCSGWEVLEPSKSELLIKSNTFDGNHDLTVAEFRFEFDEDLYAQSAAPCAGGLCTQTAEMHAGDPCFPIACDFTLKGDDCGKPAAPECKAICDAQRPTLCPEVQDWVVLEVDVESPVYFLSNLITPNMQFRFNWDKICQPIMLEVIYISGEVSAFVSATAPTFPVETIDECFWTAIPDSHAALCPSNKRCYKYGTYFGFVVSFHTTDQFALIIRSLPIENITSPHVVSPAECPPTYFDPINDPYDAISVPVALGVPFFYTFTGYNTVLPFVLHTPYCGFLHLQAEVVDYEAYFGFLVVFASTANPFPSNFGSDWNHHFLGEFAPIYVCPSTDTGNVTVWFLVARTTVASDLSIYFTVDIDRPSLPRLPSLKLGAQDPSFSNLTTFSPYPPWFGIVSGAMKLTCQTPSGVAEFTCTIGCASVGCCRSAFPAYSSYPVNNSLTLVPYPWTMRTDPRFETTGPVSFIASPEAARKFSFVLVLSQALDGQITAGALGLDWETYLPTCTISSDLSSIGTSDGRWLGSNTFTPAQTSLSCDYEEFVKVAQQMNDLSAQLAQTISAADTATLRYEADLLTLSDGWIGCFNYVDDTLLNSSLTPRSLSSTTICPSFDAEDPCCNPALWTECCIPRSINYTADVYTANSESIGECQNPQCDTPLSSTFAFNREYVESRSCSTSSDTSARVSAALIAHRRCLEAYYGDDVDGITCYADASCPVNQRCDLFNHRCVAQNLTIADFYSCLEANISSTLRIAFINYNNWTTAIERQSFQVLLASRYTTTDICMSENFGHPYSPLRVTYPIDTTVGCPACPITALDQTYIPPPWCGQRALLGSPCFYILQATFPNDSPSLCNQTDTVCNWNSTVSAAACNNVLSPTSGTDNQFCGVCESSTSCFEVPATSESNCANIGEVCVLSDGTVDTSLNANECAATYRCSQLCSGGPCASATACTEQGYCEDEELIYTLLDGTFWATTHSREGFCAFAMVPYNNPDCDTYIFGSNPSSYGCVSFGNCSYNGVVETCTVNYDTEVSCTRAGGTWYPKWTTKALCETPVLCSAPLLQGLDGLSLTRYNFLVDSDTCETCGGVRRPVNTWVPGEWNPGTMRKLVWTDRSAVSPYGYGASIDTMMLVNDLNSAAILSTQADSLNNLQCTYNTLKKSALKLTCDCLTTDLPDVCFSIAEDGVLGKGTLCPLTTSTIEAPPIVITTTASDFSSSLVNSCVECTLKTTLLPAFDPEPIVSVTIAFAKLRQKVNRGSYRSVQNDNYAIVGQAIGDAVDITFDSSADVSESLLSFSICMTLSSSVTADTESYPVYDFAHPLSDFTSRPLGIEVVFYQESNSLCGNITYGERGSSIALIPVVRLESYKDIAGPKLTDGQKACLIVVGSLFALSFTILAVQCLRLVTNSGFDWRTASNMLWPLFGVLLLLRAIYLFLVAGEVLNLPSSHQLVDYFMMDFPMVLYLLSNLLIGLSFVFLRIQQSQKRLGKLYFWASFCCLGFLVIMLFISTLLAYRYQVLNKPPISGSLLCPTVYDATSTARTIRLIYESIILFIALTIGLTVLLVGMSLWKQMAEVYGAERILILCVVASVGIIGDSVAFLIYYIVNDPNPFFSIVLIFTEVVPITFISVQLSNTQINQSSQSSQMSRRPSAATASPTFSR